MEARTAAGGRAATAGAVFLDCGGQYNGDDDLVDDAYALADRPLRTRFQAHAHVGERQRELRTSGCEGTLAMRQKSRGCAVRGVHRGRDGLVEGLQPFQRSPQAGIGAGARQPALRRLALGMVPVTEPHTLG
jgi:hypothetical protein